MEENGRAILSDTPQNDTPVLPSKEGAALALALAPGGQRLTSSAGRPPPQPHLSAEDGGRSESRQTALSRLYVGVAYAFE